ncbi:MAG TPA: DUF3604 domain-containing protein [Geminicoccaceae bacterium]|nr:DUF3604 domain-containing protein [Geminicoccaceae bacterium]
MKFVRGGLATAVWSVALLGVALPESARSEESPPFVRTEVREDCASYDPLRQPFFGETHLHTAFSFDAYTFSNRNDPDAAYAFAKGAPINLPAWDAQGDGPQTRTAQLRRPLDFTAVTDHSELFGEMEICTRSAPGTPGYDSIACQQMRTGELIPGNPTSFNPFGVTALWGLLPILLPDNAFPLPMCAEPGVDCEAASISIWQAIQDAAEDAYDRSSDCTFTSFIGYEYTAQPQFANLHRNVIFRNGNVTEDVISNVTTGGPYPTVLWEKLQEECIDPAQGCDVLTIPHNANLSGGEMFPDPENAEEAATRAFFEPLTEIYQHKSGSECRYDRLAKQGSQTTDTLCTFEQSPVDVLNTSAPPVPIDQYPPRNMIRNVLKDGLALAPGLEGVNPFKYGIIASTDSHNADPGNTVEQDFQGHGGTEDAPPAAMVDHIRPGPAGLAVVWAEENSRDAIFTAMRRKETYGTSGTRPIVRFFGGWDFDTRGNKLCSDPNRVQIGYDQGVPMGADLPPRPAGKKPTFMVAALKDPESASLQQIQIVKGWVDGTGQTREQVLSVAGSQAQGGVNTNTCQPLPGGFNELCTVWEDKQFDPARPAFYYARVLERATCRWSVFACRAGGVDPFASPKQCQQQAAAANATAVALGQIQADDAGFANCCLNEKNDPFMERTIHERAWTSPIWYTPGG